MNVQEVLPRDAIPSVDDPTFGREYFGDPEDDVIVVDGDPARAYPIRVLSFHEVVNDAVGGRPVAVTWCPICWSAVVYDRRVDGRTLTFGVSGKLADDALVMYDRETGTEWKQPTGEAIDGELTGHTLTALSAPMLTYGRFRDEHPDGVVLQPVRGTDPGESPAEVYDMSRYEQYVAGEAFGLRGMRGEGPKRSWDREDLDAKTLVLGVERDGAANAYPVPGVEAAGGLVTDRVGDRDLVVIAADGGLHVFADPGFDYELRDGTVHADGTTWDPTTGESADDRRLDRVPTRQMFAFAWQDAHGPGAFYSP